MCVTLRSVRTLLLALVCFAARLTAQTPCEGTPAYSPCEFVFELQGAEASVHPNPYGTVELHAEFRSPHFHTYLVPAFWDGHKLILRFVPTEAGEWIYRFTSNLASVEGKQGTFRAADSASKSRNTPFDGRAFKGAPMVTIVAGRVVYRRNA